jgi:hypothetical protein
MMGKSGGVSVWRTGCAFWHNETQTALQMSFEVDACRALRRSEAQTFLQMKFEVMTVLQMSFGVMTVVQMSFEVDGLRALRRNGSDSPSNVI